jgi:hypothetical protein
MVEEACASLFLAALVPFYHSKESSFAHMQSALSL